jgi:Fe(3+) dicitrate transport protein
MTPTERAFKPVDSAFLGAFRILFGLLMFYGVVRFLANGWVEQYFVEPGFHFKYWGFEWVRAWPIWGMYLHFAALGLLALSIALGLFYRVAIVLFFLGFSYIELIDVSMYLNHYYLVSLLALLLAFLPADGALSLDALRRPALRRDTVPAYQLYLLRFQVGIVYFFAGLAKLQPDWLLHAQPLNIWLSSRSDFLLLGASFREPWLAYALSWGGFLFDTTIPLWLSFKKTRGLAYLVLIGFHLMTGALFAIGLFPVIMTLSALVFFPPNWPRALAGRLRSALPRALARLERFAAPVGAAPGVVRASRFWFGIALAYALVQVLVPLRHRLYEGDVLWHEQGMRWSWKVMVRAKNASVTYRVYAPASGRTFHVSPSRYLTVLQEREMASQPDLVLQLAHHIAAEFRARGHGEVEVYAEVLSSLNGRKPVQLVDSSIDLARVEDGIGRAAWITREPSGAPALLRPCSGPRRGERVPHWESLSVSDRLRSRALVLLLSIASPALGQEPKGAPPPESPPVPVAPSETPPAPAEAAPELTPQALDPRASADPVQETEPVEVVISGTPVSRVGGSAHVVNGRTLERFEYDDAHAVLQTVPGVYARGEDGLGLRPNIGIRGALSDRSKKVTLLEDGVPIAPAPYSAPAAYYMPLVTRMARVRVIKGPAAIEYGPQTIAGAVDFVTRPIPAAGSGQLDLAAGEYAYGKFHGWAGTGSENMSFLLEGVHLQSDGFKQLPGGEDTGFYRNEWVLKGAYLFDPTSRVEHELGLKLSYSDELSNETYLGLSDADFRKDPLRRYGASKLDQMRWHRTALAVSHRLAPTRDFEITTTVYRHDFSRVWRKVNGFLGRDLLEVLRNPAAPENANFYEILAGRADSTSPDERLMIGPNAREFVAHGVTSVATLKARTGPLRHRFVYGLRLHYDRVERRHSEDAFLVIDGDLIPAGGTTTVTAENEAWTEAAAFHAADSVEVGGLTLNPGLRVELMRSAFVDKRTRGERRASAQAILPGVGAAYAFNDELSVLAGVYRGFSPPPPGSDEQGPELAVNYEAGARFVSGTARVELIGYLSDYSNLTNICSTSGSCRDQDLDRQFDAGRARVHGVEAYAAWDAPLGSLKLPLLAAYTLARSNFLSSFDSGDPIFGAVERGDELPYVPRHQVKASAGVEHERAGGYVAATYVAAMREQAGSEPLERTLSTDEQFTIDVGAKYRLVASLELYANVRNLFDAHAVVSHRPFGARPNAPRWAQAGAKLSF